MTSCSFVTLKELKTSFIHREHRDWWWLFCIKISFLNSSYCREWLNYCIFYLFLRVCMHYPHPQANPSLWSSPTSWKSKYSIFAYNLIHKQTADKSCVAENRCLQNRRRDIDCQINSHGIKAYQRSNHLRHQGKLDRHYSKPKTFYLFLF